MLLRELQTEAMLHRELQLACHGKTTSEAMGIDRLVLLR